KRIGGESMNFNVLTDEVLYVLIGIVGILVISTAITLVLKKQKPSHTVDEVMLRIKSWWVMLFIFTFALVIHSTISLIFMGLLSFLALKEYFSLLTLNRTHSLVLFWSYIDYT